MKKAERTWTCDTCKRGINVHDLHDITDRRVTCWTCFAAAVIVEHLLEKAIPAWAAPHLNDYAQAAVERLIAKGLAERRADGSVVAK